MGKVHIDLSPDEYFKSVKELAVAIKGKFMDWGILTGTSIQNQEVLKDGGVVTVSDTGDWLQVFLIRHSAEAFYKNIGSQADVENKVHEFEQDLENMHATLARFAEQNESLNEEMRKKITRLNAGVSRAKKAMSVRGKSLLRDCAENCSTVEELQKATARVFAKLLEEKIFDGVIWPLYEGIASGHDDVYIFIIKKLNEMLIKWGVVTWPIEVGYQMNDMSYSIYEPTSDSQHNYTQDPNLKESVKEIMHYAYGFNDGAEIPYIIWHGSVSLWRYGV